MSQQIHTTAFVTHEGAAAAMRQLQEWVEQTLNEAARAATVPHPDVIGPTARVVQLSHTVAHTDGIPNTTPLIEVTALLVAEVGRF